MRPIGRDVYNRLYLNIQETLNPEIYEIAPNTKLGNFQGYQNVCLKHKDLQLIVNNNEPNWKHPYPM